MLCLVPVGGDPNQYTYVSHAAFQDVAASSLPDLHSAPATSWWVVASRLGWSFAVVALTVSQRHEAAVPAVFWDIVVYALFGGFHNVPPPGLMCNIHPSPAHEALHKIHDNRHPAFLLGCLGALVYWASAWGMGTPVFFGAGLLVSLLVSALVACSCLWASGLLHLLGAAAFAVGWVAFQCVQAWALMFLAPFRNVGGWGVLAWARALVLCATALLVAAWGWRELVAFLSSPVGLAAESLYSAADTTRDLHKFMSSVTDNINIVNWEVPKDQNIFPQ